MDQTQTQQKITEYYEKLPPDAQQVFASMTWMETLKGISARYTLNEDQIATLATETTLALLGIVHIDEYEKTLIKELQAPLETINKILDEVDTKIMKSVRPLLHETFIKNANDLVDPRVVSLADHFQEALVSSDYKEKLSALAKKYSILSSEKAQAFEDAAVKLITKSYSEKQFQGSLILATNMEVATAQQISHELNEGLGLEIQKKADEYLKNEAKGSDTTSVPLPPYAPKPQAPSYTEKIPDLPQQTEPAIASAPIVKSEPIATPAAAMPVQKSVFSSAGIEMVGASSHPEPAVDTTPKKAKDPYHEDIE